MKNIGKTLIFLICLYSAFFLAGGVFAPICAAAGEFEVSAKLTSLYMSSCHQAPDRSFWFLGFPFALCCRCLGFYLGVVLSGICSLLCKLKLSLRLFLILALIVIIDIFGKKQFIFPGNRLAFQLLCSFPGADSFFAQHPVAVGIQ